MKLCLYKLNVVNWITILSTDIRTEFLLNELSMANLKNWRKKTSFSSVTNTLAESTKLLKPN